MTLQEIIEDLSYGEMSQIYLGGASTQGITLDNMPLIVNHINRALSVLHTRFRLKEGRLVLPLEEGVSEYRLEHPDLPVLRLERVLWPQGLPDTYIAPPGENPVMPVNDESHPLSLYTPNHHTLQVPGELYELGVRELIVIYRAGHPKFTKESIMQDPDLVVIDLPETFREPLIYYIASQVFNPIGTSAGTEGFHAGNDYRMKYEESCQRLEAFGWDVRSTPESHLFHSRGFV